MKVFENTYAYSYPWGAVTLAVWMKYPNPFSTHVLHSDVLSRRLIDGKLYTTRLFNKTGSMPKWGAAIFRHQPTSLVIEESVVDVKSGVMVTRTRNASHQRFLKVEEMQTIRVHPENKEWTQVSMQASIVSHFGFGLTQRLETMGVTRFRDNTTRSRRAMHHVLEGIGRQLPWFQRNQSP